MLFEPTDIKTMRAALAAAERALFLAYPSGLDEKTRETLARSIIQDVTTGQRNPMILSTCALRKLDAKSAA